MQVILALIVLLAFALLLPFIVYEYAREWAPEFTDRWPQTPDKLAAVLALVFLAVQVAAFVLAVAVLAL